MAHSREGMERADRSYLATTSVDAQSRIYLLVHVLRPHQHLQGIKQLAHLGDQTIKFGNHHFLL